MFANITLHYGVARRGSHGRTLACTDTSRRPEHGTGGGLSARDVTVELRRSKNDPALLTAPHPRASEHGALQSTRSGSVRARVRAVRSSGCLCSTLANVGLELANAPGQAQGCSLNSNRKRTHVYTLCAGALHGALARRVQPVKRAARDRGSTLLTR